MSDTEAAALEPDADARAERLASAQAKVADGRGADLMPDLFYGFAPISAARYASLVGRYGADDMFSSYLTDAELASRLGHMSTAGQRLGLGCEPIPDHPGLLARFVCSASDEYVPPNIDARELASRLVRASTGDRPEESAEGSVEAMHIEGANHNLSAPPEAERTFVAAVGEWLAQAVDA